MYRWNSGNGSFTTANNWSKSLILFFYQDKVQNEKYFASKSTREDFVQTWHVKVASQRWEKCSIFADNGCTKSDQQLSFLRTNIRLIVVPEKGFHALSIPSQYNPTSNANQCWSNVTNASQYQCSFIEGKI